MDTSRAPATEKPPISYAQNNEDILLWRALGDLGTGIYVDVGANSPRLHSVTRLFYDRGWRGINIEPVTSWFDELERERTRDVNLKICLSDSDGEADFVEVADTGLSTLDLDVAAGYTDRWETRTVRRPTRTLAGVLSEHRLPEIHFLKIDVEGAEHQVLRGADFAAHRPWIVLVESIRPDTGEPSHESWEPILEEADYVMLAFDGVNRFYAARERFDAIEPHFRSPVNVLDDFIPVAMHDADVVHRERADALEELGALHHRTHQELRETHQRLVDALAQVEAAERRAAWAEGELARLTRSISWRLTSPIRRLGEEARRRGLSRR